MNKFHTDRLNRIMPNGKPRWVRCYDNGGETVDRYTVVFTGNWPGHGKSVPGYGQLYPHVGMSSAPFHPQGFGQYGEHNAIIDRPTYGHLGRKIKFDDLPQDCQRLVIDLYRNLWQLCHACGVSGTKWYEPEYKWLCKEHAPLPQEKFVECGSCGAYHRADFHGDCRDNSERFEELPENGRIVSVAP